MSASDAEIAVTNTEAAQPNAEKVSVSSLSDLIRAQIAAGEGAKCIREENHLSPLAAAKLRYQAIRRQWIRPTIVMPWPVEARIPDFVGLAAEQPLSVMDQIAFEVLLDVFHEDARIRSLAIRSVLNMKAQNQKLLEQRDREELRRKRGRRDDSRVSGI